VEHTVLGIERPEHGLHEGVISMGVGLVDRVDDEICGLRQPSRRTVDKERDLDQPVEASESCSRHSPLCNQRLDQSFVLRLVSDDDAEVSLATKEGVEPKQKLLVRSFQRIRAPYSVGCANYGKQSDARQIPEHPSHVGENPVLGFSGDLSPTALAGPDRLGMKFKPMKMGVEIPLREAVDYAVEFSDVRIVDCQTADDEMVAFVFPVAAFIDVEQERTDFLPQEKATGAP
jgi:hypothetical protein